jgi:hypothetical protein
MQLSCKPKRDDKKGHGRHKTDHALYLVPPWRASLSRHSFSDGASFAWPESAEGAKGGAP